MYTGNGELHRQFADSLFGGPEGSLRAAIEWRDQQRAALPPPPERPPRPWRIVRADYTRANARISNRGWLAYADRRRYFADSTYGGADAARAAAEAWLRDRRS